MLNKYMLNIQNMVSQFQYFEKFEKKIGGPKFEKIHIPI